MRCLKIIPPLLLLLPFALANAQEPLPWPPDPAEIFAPDIEIVESGIVVQPPDTRPTYDNDARVVRVYDESNGNGANFLMTTKSPGSLVLTPTQRRMCSFSRQHAIVACTVQVQTPQDNGC